MLDYKWSLFNCKCLLISVGTGLRIKIADFGLARKMNSQHFVSIEGGCVLPIRTMAPECFTSGQFTVATDVWYAYAPS